MTGPLLSNGGVLYSIPIQPAPGSLPNPTARELASGPPRRSGLHPAEPGHGQGVHYWNISGWSDDMKLMLGHLFCLQHKTWAVRRNMRGASSLY